VSVAAFARFLGIFRGKKTPVRADFLVFGIGNPGKRFEGTRHNAGFMAVERLGRLLERSVAWREPRYTAETGRLWGGEIALVKPGTFVNACGPAFAASLSRFGVPSSSALVVVDDYHLPLGAIRLRRGGSDGGHNGLASIIKSCGEDFPRLRIGIGPLNPAVSSVDFVLGKFDDQEKAALDKTLDTAAEAVRAFCEGGMERAMNLFNGNGAPQRRARQKQDDTFGSE
jgi:peptidyl-tRNA hydrolase, PTH1 family